eukprot:scaffold499197_cov23-Prasinocladus_malaysianus.AAC.1
MSLDVLGPPILAMVPLCLSWMKDMRGPLSTCRRHWLGDLIGVKQLDSFLRTRRTIRYSPREIFLAPEGLLVACHQAVYHPT